MTNSRIINALAVATLVAAGWWLCDSLQPQPPAVDRRPHLAAGEALAAEAVRLLTPGAKLTVIARAATPFQVPASAAQLEGFQRALKKNGTPIAALREYQLDPLRPVSVPPGDFFELMRRGQDNDVIVSFLGPPVLDGGQLAKLGAKRPRVLAMCSGAMPQQVDLQRLFDQQLLWAAVVSRNDAPVRKTARSGQQAFDQMFRWITRDNLRELADVAAPGR